MQQEFTTFIDNHTILFIVAVIVILCIIVVEYLRAKRGSFSINPLAATQLINHQNASIFDIRARDVYDRGHIIDAISISSAEVQQLGKKIEKFKNKPIIVVCNAGVESQKIATFLLRNGYNAFSLAGGMRGWLSADMPIVKEGK